MYCIGVFKGMDCFYWSGHVLYWCVKGIDCFYWSGHVLYWFVRGYRLASISIGPFPTVWYFVFH